MWNQSHNVLPILRTPYCYRHCTSSPFPWERGILILLHKIVHSRRAGPTVEDKPVEKARIPSNPRYPLPIYHYYLFKSLLWFLL